MMTMMTLVTTKTDTLAHIVAGCYKVDQSANAQFVVSRSYSRNLVQSVLSRPVGGSCCDRFEKQIFCNKK